MNQGKTTISKNQAPVQQVESSNASAMGYAAVTRFAQPAAGLPAQLKRGVESLSGLPMDDVQVHYNSKTPTQIGALAYAKGNQIHLGPGQEQHLPHEAWHVVQQKQGRVKPTLQAKGLAINDNPALETEADVMGQRAAQLKTADDMPATPLNNPVSQPAGVVQRKIGLEFQAVDSIFLKNITQTRTPLGGIDNMFHIEGDGDVGPNGPDLEIITNAVDETDTGREHLVRIMAAIVKFLNKIEHHMPFEKLNTAEGLIEKVIPKDTKDVKAENLETKDASSVIDWNEIVTDSFQQNFKKKYEGERKTKEEKGAALNKTRKSFKEHLESIQKEAQSFHIPNGEKFFSPQATVGIKFDNVVDLIEHLTRAPFKNAGIEQAPPEEKDEAKITGTHTGAQMHANIIGWGNTEPRKPFRQASIDGLNEAKKIPGTVSRKVRGLAAIFYGFAKNESEDHKTNIRSSYPKGAYVKDWMPFMLRNGFWAFINSLTEKELREIELLMGGSALDLPIVSGLDAGGHDEIADAEIQTIKEVLNHSLKRKKAILNKEKAKEGKEEEGKEEKKEEEEETKEEEEEDDDPLQALGIAGYGQISETTLKYDTKLKEKYKIESIDDIGISNTEREPLEPKQPAQRGAIIELSNESSEPKQPARRGAIIELRKLGSQVPVEKLTEFALAVFDLIREIHDPGITTRSSSSSSSSSSSLSSVPSSSSSSSSPAPSLSSSSSSSLSSSPQ
ncbi:DUF4157 domain-containing protein [Mucilaginibacter angelicae]|uniref:DUF4157 domain-containing protein n=1 Tax=Mucilaginibacter angelicae TaxID=869718 RepID=A0ABV6KZN5_9SPHI